MQFFRYIIDERLHLVMSICIQNPMNLYSLKVIRTILMVHCKYFVTDLNPLQILNALIDTIKLKQKQIAKPPNKSLFFCSYIF